MKHKKYRLQTAFQSKINELPYDWGVLELTNVSGRKTVTSTRCLHDYLCGPNVKVDGTKASLNVYQSSSEGDLQWMYQYLSAKHWSGDVTEMGLVPVVSFEECFTTAKAEEMSHLEKKTAGKAGCYEFLDSDGHSVYIGESINLYSRLFNHAKWTSEVCAVNIYFVKEVVDIGWMEKYLISTRHPITNGEVKLMEGFPSIDLEHALPKPKRFELAPGPSIFA